MSIPSPLHEIHTELGASFTDFAGWSMPVRYSSELAEHRAVRDCAGIFDLSHMAEIEVIGTQASEVLDYAMIGNFSGLKVGRARYTMLCDADGGVLDDLVVYRLGMERFMVVANAANAEVVLSALSERATGFPNGTVRDRAADFALIAVQGPNSAEIIRAAIESVDLEGGLDALRYYASTPAVLAGNELLLARTGYTGEDGFELYCSPSQAVQVWRTLSEIGTPQGLLPAGLACRDTLRLEAGMPLYGNELHTGLTPFDAGFDRLVKFDKPGDFVGRNALAGGASGTQVLVGLRGTGRRAPRHGYRVLDGDADVGVVTSGALAPTLGYPIAMAYVSTESSGLGRQLAVDIRGRLEQVEVTGLPFYQRSK